MARKNVHSRKLNWKWELGKANYDKTDFLYLESESENYERHDQNESLFFEKVKVRIIEQKIYIAWLNSIVPRLPT